MKTLKRPEEVNANEYRDMDQLRENIAAFIDNYYNRVSAPSGSMQAYAPPEEFEQTASSRRSRREASMSFFRHGEIFRSDVGSKTKREACSRPANRQ